MSIYSHKSKKDSLWLHFTVSKIVTPLKRLAVGWEALLNTRGTTWRKLDETTRNKITDAASAAALMTEMPAIIKRPLLCAPGKPMLLGFSDSSYQQFFHEV
ncbi:ArsC family reductase [Escherichia coli]